jgi:hypothetical protein
MLVQLSTDFLGPDNPDKRVYAMLAVRNGHLYVTKGIEIQP